VRSVATKSVIAVSVAAFLALIGAVATAEAGHGGGGKGGGIHMGGSAFKGGGGGKFHGYSGGGKSFRYGGGGKSKGFSHGKSHGNHYAYGGQWPGNYGHYKHYGNSGHYRRYGYYPWYGLPLYSYGGGCGWLYRNAVATGSDYWWDRYYQCTGYY
jgi:hypothetical protein